ncbi:MAG: hypothetical protein EZS28_047781 [Streblomastix strix]|uniref:Uncharacterized protein n=1 Tax=Streblomastix strix TaxID=222440 RepID=A0A5J4TFQ3_9EUKA|nr:MAG: hypothetical protein EZS28_047781 [Streblomastix strix]
MPKIDLERSETIVDTSKTEDSEEVVKNTYHSHPKLEVMKFIKDRIWSTITTRKRENEEEIEIVLEEPLMRSHSCIDKSYKKKDLLRVIDVLIKNVSISVIDNILYNSIEKLYRGNKDFVRLSDASTSEISKDDF